MPPVSWPIGLHLLALAQRGLGVRAALHLGVERGGALGDLVLKRLVHALRLGEQAGVVDADSRLGGKPDGEPFGARGEDVGIGMAEEQRSVHLARTCEHRHREVAPDREMPFRHSPMRLALAVAGMGGDIA